MPRPQPDPCIFPPEIQLKRILPLREAALLLGISVDSLVRHHSHLICDLGPRRRGMSVENALSIPHFKKATT
jgi:hypothetical protein